MNAVKDTPAINPQQILSMKAGMAAEKFDKELKSVRFPQTRLSDNWKDLAEKAICKVSPLSLRISMKDFKQVFSADVDDISLFEFACLSNAIEAISFDQSGMDEEVYIKTLEEALKHVEYYALESNKIRSKVEKDVEKEVSMKVAAMHGTVTTPAGANNSILTPVKGEA